MGEPLKCRLCCGNAAIDLTICSCGTVVPEQNLGHAVGCGGALGEKLRTIAPLAMDMTKLPKGCCFSCSSIIEYCAGVRQYIFYHEVQLKAELAEKQENEVDKKAEEPKVEDTAVTEEHIQQIEEKPDEVQPQNLEQKTWQKMECDICGKKLDYIDSLIRHRRSLHKENKDFVCKMCPDFSTKVLLEYKTHLRSHRDIVKISRFGLICDICGLEFLGMDSFCHHRDQHNAPRFSCRFCGKHFRSKRNMTQHERIHTGEKPFTCEICGKSFPANNYLISHRKIHLDRKTFTCPTCKKAFFKKWNLIQHERTHTGERPFKCQFCLKEFTQSYLLKTHLVVVHKTDWSSCQKPKKTPENRHLYSFLAKK